MESVIASILAGLLLTTVPAPAALVCSYDGELYAHPALEREFHDARQVVRARVVAVKNSWLQHGTYGDEQPWTMSTVRVVEDFKGEAPDEISLFTWRDSGAFYTDDVGGEYLLFLNPHGFNPAPAEATGAMTVNYCGNSRPWIEVPEAERAMLQRMKAGRARAS